MKLQLCIFLLFGEISHSEHARIDNKSISFCFGFLPQNIMALQLFIQTL